MKTGDISLKRILFLVFGGILFGNCGGQDNILSPTGIYASGVVVVNEGNFLDNNGSISFLNRTDKTANLDIFYKENNQSFSGILNDYTEIDGKGIVLVDNSTDGKDAIEIVKAESFKTIASIKNQVENPRRTVKITNTKAYVVCWDAINSSDYSFKNGYIAVLDLSTNMITKKIVLNKGPESIAVIGKYAYIGNVNYDTTIQVVDTSTDEVVSSISVGTNPNNFIATANNTIWLSTDEMILELNPATKTILKSYPTKVPTSKLSLDASSNLLYHCTNYYDENDNYQHKGSLNVLDISTMTNKVFNNKIFSALGSDSQTKTIYAGFTPSYKQAGYIFRYQATGVLVDSIQVQIAPNKFYFK